MPKMARPQMKLIISTILIAQAQVILINLPAANCLAIDQKSPNGNQLAEQTISSLAASKATKEFKQSDVRRPIWNLAHMVNSIKELEYRLSKGANAVEVDVTFSREGDPIYTYHGPPCDCWRHCHQREDFNEYLSFVREIAIDDHEGIGRNLSLLFLDLKLDYLDHKGKIRAGIELAKSVVANLYLDNSTEWQSKSMNGTNSLSRKPIKLMISVNHVGDSELVNNFIHHLERNNLTHLMDRIGFDVGMNDDIQQIESMWKRFGTNSLNLWQGDGYTNCFSPFQNLERLSRAITKRDNEAGYPRKVYQWTIDIHDRIREALMMGVDAVMTNHPERLISVLSEREIAHNFRLANHEDDPFMKIIYKPNSRSSESARYQRSTNGPTGGGFLSSMMDVINSWLAYIREIPLLSLPTTSRLLPKYKRHKQAILSTSKVAQAQYRADAGNSTNPSNPAASSNSSLAPLLEESKSSPESIGGDPQNGQPLYEGPKWYTSALSNALVSVLKLLLPAQ